MTGEDDEAEGNELGNDNISADGTEPEEEIVDEILFKGNVSGSDGEEKEASHETSDKHSNNPSKRIKRKNKKRVKKEGAGEGLKTKSKRKTKSKLRAKKGRDRKDTHVWNRRQGKVVVVNSGQLTAGRVKLRFCEGEVGINLNWDDEANRLKIIDFPPLNSGASSVAKECGVIAIGSYIVSINDEDLSGLAREQVLNKLYTPEFLKTGNSPVLEFQANDEYKRHENQHSRGSERITEDRTKNDSQLGEEQDDETSEDEESKDLVNEDERSDDESCRERNSRRNKLGVRRNTRSKTQLFREDSKKSLRSIGSKRSSASILSTSRLTKEPSSTSLLGFLENVLCNQLEQKFLTSRAVILKRGGGISIVGPASDISINVRNVSVETALRFYMGPKKFSSQIVSKNNSGSGFWEARIFKLEPAPPGQKKNYGPTTSFVGTFTSEKEASRAADRAIANRNKGETGASLVPNKELCQSKRGMEDGKLVTHLRIRVKSDNFENLSLEERAQYCWQLTQECECLDRFKVQNEFSTFRGVSFAGDNFKRLKLFSYIPIVFEFSAIYAEKRERTLSAFPAKVKKRIEAAQEKAKVRLAPLSPKEVGTFVESEDKVFTGLSAEAKHLMEKKNVAEETAIRMLRETTKKIEGLESKGRPPSAKSDRPSSPSRNPSFAFGLKEEPEKPELKLWKTNRRYLRAARSLQRIYRSRQFPFLIRNSWRMNVLVMTLQRVIRGFIGRRRAFQWKCKAHASAETLQRFWWMVRAQRIARAFRKLRTDAVCKIQPIVRGMLARNLLAWKMKDDWAAVKMQRVLRGHFARVEVKKRMAKAFHEQTVVPAVINIQRCGRGMLGRKIVKEIRAEKYYREVVIPSAITLQAIARGQAAKKVLIDLKMQQFASTSLQRVLRGKLQRRRYRILVEDNDRKVSATKIASLVRGYICRKLVELMRREHRRTHVETPAAVKLQAFWKGILTRRWFRVLVKQDVAVLIIQAAWRTVIARRQARETMRQVAQEYKSRLAVRLQTCFRGLLGRRAFETRRRELNARRIVATRTIQRYWKRYKKYLQSKVEKEEVRRQLHYLNIQLVEVEIEEIKHDMEEIRAELSKKLRYISKSKKARKKIKKERHEMERRLPDIEMELSKLDPEDESLIPWKEAYETEIEVLSNIIALSAEEIAGKKLQLVGLKEDVLDLEMELEELDAELEVVMEKKIKIFEEFRVLEVELCAKRFQEHQQAMIRKQRTRWRVKDVRRKIIKRMVAEATKASAPRFEPDSMERVGTVSVSKRKYFEEKDELNLDVKKIQNRLTAMEQFKAAGQNSVFIRESYDKAMGNVKGLVDNFTYEMRRPKTDIRSDPRRVCQTCGQVMMACKCHDVDERVE